jgi:hypothetical protein
MRGIFIPVFLVFILLPVLVSAEIYYVDASRPDDSGDGLSPVYFEKGQTWQEQLSVPSSGNSTDQITFGAYGSGNKPIITGVEDIPGWAIGGNWTAGSETETFYPDAHVETSSVDGIAIHGSDNTAWATIQGGAGTYGDASGVYGAMYASLKSGSVSDWEYIRRSIVVFDTSVLPDDANITSATLSLYGYVKSDGLNITPDLNIYLAAPASNTDVVAGDYNSLGTTAYCDAAITYAGFDANGWNDFVFNATGITAISKTIPTRFGVREATHDAGNSEPGGVPAGQYSSFAFYEADTDNNGKTPKLVVTYDSTTVWYIDCTNDPQRLFIDGTEYIEAENEAGIDATYRWWYDSGNTRLYIYATENPSTAYSSIEGSRVNIASAVFISGVDYITIENIEVRGGNYAINNYLADNTIIDSCTVGLYSWSGILVQGQAVSPYTPSTYGEIKDCTVWSGINHGSSTWRNGVHDGINLANGCQYWKVHDNDVRNWGHTLIGLGVNDANLRSTQNEIYSNYLASPNTNYCRGMHFEGIAADKCDHNKFYYNYIKDTTASNSFQGNDNEFYYNIIDTVTDGGYSPVCDGLDMNCDDGSTYVCKDNKIYNNIIYNTERYGIKMDGFTGTGNKQGNLFRNNIIMDWGDSYQAIFMQDHASVKDNTWENNCVYDANVANSIYYKSDGAISVATWNGKNEDGDVIANNIACDPLFVNASNDDFHLQFNSLCIDNGTDVGLTLDFEGNPVPQGNASDIGAYEYAGGTPGDLDNDGDVDILDLGIIAGDFGKTSGFDPRADVVPNNEIDVFDVVFVASRFT